VNETPNHPVIEVNTSAGLVVVEVFADSAPTTAAYVIDLVRRGVYDGSSFYRSTTLGRTREPLIQGGPFCRVITGVSDVEPDIAKLQDFETTVVSGKQHVKGAVSLARDLFRTGHAISEWFVCLDDYPDLDFEGRSEPDSRGFPVFGTVIEGLDVVRSIAGRRTGAASPNRRLDGEMLFEPVEISAITIAS